jgi:tRNA-binding protein
VLHEGKENNEMIIFYNEKGVGDILLAQLELEKPKETMNENIGDITLIKDAETQKIVAFNLFNASKYVTVEANGEVDLTEEFIGKVQLALRENNVDLELDVDLSPKFVIGHIIKKDTHPNADRLNVCTVDVGNETLQIVCGASNIDADQKVVVAKVGAVMPSGLVIKDAELRGVASSGMICSASELALPDAVEGAGILVLDEKSVVGQPYIK